MNALKTGGLDVVGNCDLISEGFDAPACDVIMMGSPTRSVTRFLQQAGRAMRPAPGKTALILDLAGNSHELGLPDDVREWSLEDGEIRDPKKTIKSPRECPRCHTMFWGRLCPECQHAIPLAEVAEVETELEEATPAQPRGGGRRSSLWAQLAMAYKSKGPRGGGGGIGQAAGIQGRLGQAHSTGEGTDKLKGGTWSTNK